LSSFWCNFGAPKPPKSGPKHEKNDIEKQHGFCIDFFMILGWFLRGFWMVFGVRMTQKPRMRVLKKGHKTLAMATISRIAFKKNMKNIKKSNKITRFFGLRF